MDKETTDGWMCHCKDSAIRRVDATRPHVAISREGWFCMGCLKEFAPTSGYLTKNLDNLHENALQLRQSAIEKGDDRRERYCLGLLDAIRTIRTIHSLPNAIGQSPTAENASPITNQTPNNPQA